MSVIFMTQRSLGVKIFFFSSALFSGLIVSLTQSWAIDYCSGRVCKAHEIATRREDAASNKDRFRLGQFDFYVLALSWSAEFCQRSGNASEQCAENKNLGFVVHGLWPQFYIGYPLYCRNDAVLSANNMERALKQFPTARLARYEWRKHGVCSGKTPSAYLEDVSKARNLFKIPQSLVDPKDGHTMSLKALYGDFLKINPNLDPGMFSINCRHGALTEVRVCISKNLRQYQLCPQVLRQSCRTSDIFIPSFH
jgi:ribonuclease T2